MSAETDAVALKLAELAVRHTAGSVNDRIRALKARKKDQETISELEEIVYDLLADKNELARIAQAYEQDLVAQRISDKDIHYINSSLLPIFQRLAAASGDDESATSSMLDTFASLVSVEAMKVLQLLGFNFRKAIGEPLTELVAQLISSRSPIAPEQMLRVQELQLEREVGLTQVARNPEAAKRLRELEKRN